MSTLSAIKNPVGDASLTPLGDLLQRARAGAGAHELAEVGGDDGLHAVYERLEKLVG